ncbi:hypothetical protein [Xenorhabdus ishibashii]|uniref:Replication protein n=1 Tax=Xenorhabdus ishibashii TaxID=1034471 RepID=A0A2D0KIG1_9GAMM|nr:hypothetical protein [Xenorhabdus ishibashii]PHM63230.1 replication protein [Xenorhabdus ishibashii]
MEQVGAHNPARHEQEYISNNKLLDDRPRKSKSSGRVNPDAAVSSPKGDKWGAAENLIATEWIFQKVRISVLQNIYRQKGECYGMVSTLF